ncbi:MAG TPA: RNA 2',3'-cyclic phosphodiesterase [Anaerolineales bacterium]|nr:RNA 2',3'-cyclic phosphodiesterase [Anaerolineales bacterium]
MNPLRVFIAIDLPETIQEALEKQTARLRQTLGDGTVRWVPAKNMHLTLKFIGNIAASHLDFLKQLLAQSANAHPPFDLQIGGIGSFPNAKRVRVIWAGIHAPAELTSLQRSIEAGAVRLGYEKEERAFSPHLTLGRVRQTAAPADIQKVAAALGNIQLGSIGIARVDSVHLYKSELRREGSVYTRLFSAPLSKSSKP